MPLRWPSIVARRFRICFLSLCISRARFLIPPHQGGGYQNCTRCTVGASTPSLVGWAQLRWRTGFTLDRPGTEAPEPPELMIHVFAGHLVPAGPWFGIRRRLRAAIAPRQAPGLHLPDLALLCLNDRQGQVLDLGSCRLLERKPSSINSTPVVRDHGVDERDVERS